MDRLRNAALLALLVAPLGSVLGAGSGGGNPAGSFSTFLGGSGDDVVTVVRAGPDGTLLVAGTTSSADFPLHSALQGSPGGGRDAFVARVAADGKSLLWSTLLGGSGEDEALALAVAPDGSVWVGGATTSTDFPTVAPLQGENGGDETGFLARIAADGSALLSSTYLGGSGTDRVTGIALDGAGNAWVAGSSDSADFATTPDAFMPSPAGGTDGFVARVSSDGTVLLHASWLGGTGSDEPRALVRDGAGYVAVVGRTDSEDFPTLNGWQPSHGGGTDGFLLVLNETDGTLFTSTCIGGTGDDEANCITVRADGVYVLAGGTSSPDFPLNGGAALPLSGPSDAFLLLTGSWAGPPAFSILLGGSGDDAARALAVDGAGAYLVAGTTGSADFAVHAASQPALAGGTDGFVARVHSSGGGLLHASFFGGSGDDAVLTLALDAQGIPRIGGSTASTGFPLRSPLQGVHGGSLDGFAAAALVAPPVPSAFRSTGNLHDAVTLAWDDPAEGRAPFRLERRTGTGPWGLLAELPEGTLSHLDADVLPATSYSYRLRLVLDGDASSWTAPLALQTPQEPVPLSPAGVTALVLTPRSVSLAWEDRGDNETSYEVFRSVDGGSFAFLQTLPAGTTATVDGAAEPDRSLYYAVRAVGVSGTSPFALSGEAATPATLGVDLAAGTRTDAAKSRGDSLRLEILLGAPGGGPALDPVSSGIRVTLGSGVDAWVLDLAPHAEGWKARKGTFTWKSPRGVRSKATLSFDPATGVLKVSAKKIDLAPAAAGDLRCAVRCGGEAGSSVDPWTGGERKGRSVLAH